MADISEIIEKATEIFNTIMDSELMIKFLEFMANLSEEYPIFTQIVMAFLVINFFRNFSRGITKTVDDIISGTYKARIKEFFKLPKFKSKPFIQTTVPSSISEVNALDCAMATKFNK